MARISRALHDAGGSIEDTVDEMKGALTNVPQGFKVALRRFESINAMQATATTPMTPPVGAAGPPTGEPARLTLPGGGGPTGPTIIADTIIVQPTDPQNVEALIEEVAQAASFASTASAGPKGGPQTGLGVMHAAAATVAATGGMANVGTP